nr:stalk domain-containing protein [Anaerotignum sp. MSJ-24]
MTIDKVLEAYGVAPQIMNDRTYVPIRLVVDEIGAEVNWNGSLQKKIMGIALPNGIENGVHQLVKVALSSMVALFGTYQIAANGMAQSIWSLASIMGLQWLLFIQR